MECGESSCCGISEIERKTMKHVDIEVESTSSGEEVKKKL